MQSIETVNSSVCARWQRKLSCFCFQQSHLTWCSWRQGRLLQLGFLAFISGWPGTVLYTTLWTCIVLPQNISSEDIMDQYTFYNVLGVVPAIFIRVREAIQQRAAGAGTLQNSRSHWKQKLTGDAFAQIALRCQQKLNHSATMNFRMCSICWMLIQMPTLRER